MLRCQSMFFPGVDVGNGVGTHGRFLVIGGNIQIGRGGGSVGYVHTLGIGAVCGGGSGRVSGGSCGKFASAVLFLKE